MKGSKREVRPGVWELRAYVGKDATGTDRQKSKTFHGGARAADKALRDLVAEVEAGKYQPVTDAGTVADTLTRWMTDRHRTWSPRRRTDARYVADRYIVPHIGTMKAAKVRPPDLKRLYAKIADEVGVPTARRVHTDLHAAFAEAKRDGLLVSNPCEMVRPPKAEHRPDREVAIADVVEVWRRAVANGDTSMATLIRVALATGARRGELGALRWCDFDLEAGRVTIGRALTRDGGETVVKETKRGNTKRLALDIGTVSAVREWKAECDRRYVDMGSTMAETWFVWGGMKPLHQDTISARWGRLRDGDPDADPPVPKIGLRFHDIRHATATLMMSAGIGPAEGAARLGNTTAVFLGTYTHAAPERDRPIAELLGAIWDAEATEAIDDDERME